MKKLNKLSLLIATPLTSLSLISLSSCAEESTLIVKDYFTIESIHINNTGGSKFIDFNNPNLNFHDYWDSEFGLDILHYTDASSKDELGITPWNYNFSTYTGIPIIDPLTTLEWASQEFEMTYFLKFSGFKWSDNFGSLDNFNKDENGLYRTSLTMFYLNYLVNDKDTKNPEWNYMSRPDFLAASVSTIPNYETHNSGLKVESVIDVDENLENGEVEVTLTSSLYGIFNEFWTYGEFSKRTDDVMCFRTHNEDPQRAHFKDLDGNVYGLKYKENVDPYSYIKLFYWEANN